MYADSNSDRCTCTKGGLYNIVTEIPLVDWCVCVCVCFPVIYNNHIGGSRNICRQYVFYIYRI